MKKIYDAAHMFEAQLLVDQLQAAGFAVVVQGALLSGAAGELPVNIYPSVWVAQDDQEDAATAALHMLLQNEFRPPWRCLRCGEEHVGQFSQCWRCGAER
ncbi:MAG: DUF2007 domain-containing protein [Gammaproteobacteria bacterium]|nr:DUF2007 domain-containing protein [Gammaproteobacteria bacterium]